MESSQLSDLVINFESEVRSRLGSLSMTPSGFEKRDCMLCHLRGHNMDQKDRFGIMFAGDAISIHCFNCGYKAYWKHGDQFSKAFREFLVEIGMDTNTISRWQFSFFVATQRMGYDHEHSESPFDDPPLNFPHNILTSWKEVENDITLLSELDSSGSSLSIRQKRVLQYVEDRGLSDYKHLLGWSNSHPNRLIIPFYYNRKIVGYTGRSVNDKKPKYLNSYSDQHVSSSYLFNYHQALISDDEYVIVTDGVLDALHTNGIAVMKSSINTTQKDLIDHIAKRKKIVLVPDFDRAGFDFSSHAEKNGWYVSTPHWKDHLKDVDEMVQKYGRLLTIYSIIKNINRDYVGLKFNIQFLKKKENNTRRNTMNDS